MHWHKRYAYPHTTANGAVVTLIACTECGMEWTKERFMIPLPNLSFQLRHGRDRKPLSKKVYALLIAFWTVITGLYVYDFVRGIYYGPLWLNVIMAVFSALFLASYVRIFVQHEARMAEWYWNRAPKGGEL